MKCLRHICFLSFGILSLGGLLGCTPASPQKKSTSKVTSLSDTNTVPDVIPSKKAVTTEAKVLEKATTNLRNDKVSAFELDDSRFLIRRISVGMETYINSQTPVLDYDAPLDVDYFEIMRCPYNAVLTGTSDTMRLEDIEMSSLSSTERDRLYRNNDFFAAAAKAGCTIISQGTITLSFYDSWAPSGSYRYLVHACIAPDRLINTSKLTTRNCSKQIAVSSPVKDYVNTREKKLNENLEKANQLNSEMLMSLRAAKLKADEFACYIQWCECGSGANEQSICQRDTNGIPTQCSGGEHGRAVNKAKKDAIVKLVAVGLDLVVNFASSGPGGGLVKMIQKPLSAGSLMTGVGYAASLSGMSFSHMLQELATTTQDYPRACSKGISLDQQMSSMALALQQLKVQMDFATCQAAQASAQISAAAGNDASTVDLSACPTSPEFTPEEDPGTGE